LVTSASSGGTVAVVSSVVTAEDTSVGNSGQSEDSVRVLHFECVDLGGILFRCFGIKY
jgi:hypothetical protein